MKKSSLLLIIFLFTLSLQAQKLYLEPGKDYATARIHSRNQVSLKVKNMKVLNDTLIQYSLPGTTESGAIQKSTKEIRYIDIKCGTHALAYGLYGGGLCLLSALYAVVTVTSDANYVDTGENAGGIVAGFTAGGFVLGALIGACVPRYKVYSLPVKHSTFNFRFSPSINKNYLGCGFSAKF